MKLKQIYVVASLIACLAVSGCGGISEEDVIGKWTGKVPETGTEESDEFANAMMSMFKFELELKSDKTFDMIMMIVPASGTWEIKGGEVILTIDKFMGITKDDAEKMSGQASSSDQQNNMFEKPMVLTLSDDKQSMTGRDPSNDDSAELLFTRNEE